MLDFLLQTVVLTLAVFGVTFTIVFLDGPWDIIFRLRSKLIGVYADNPDEVNIIEAFFASVLQCFWCTAFWITIIIVGLGSMKVGYTLSTVIVQFLAVYGLCGFMYEMISDG